jgi:hypothetical protein
MRTTLAAALLSIGVAAAPAYAIDPPKPAPPMPMPVTPQAAPQLPPTLQTPSVPPRIDVPQAAPAAPAGAVAARPRLYQTPDGNWRPASGCQWLTNEPRDTRVSCQWD